MEEKKTGAKGLGKKKTDESEHFVWKDDIRVPCGKLIPSEHKDSPLEYNEYAVYDPQQVLTNDLIKERMVLVLKILHGVTDLVNVFLF